MDNSHYDEYWLSYLRAHTNAVNRFCHYLGTTFGIIGGVIGLCYLGLFIGVLVGIAGYSIALIGHFIFQKNLPHASKPHLSLISDLRMFYLFVVNRAKLESELNRAQQGCKSLGIAP